MAMGYAFWNAALMEEDGQKDKGILDLPENPKKSDVIRAYAVVKYSVERKIKQENHTHEEIEKMEAILDQARSQCIAMLADLEKMSTTESSMENVVLTDNEGSIPMNTVELNEAKPECGVDVVAIPTYESTSEAVDNSQHHESLSIEIAQGVSDEGMCGFRWLCF